jgi:hypothetical protein
MSFDFRESRRPLILSVHVPMFGIIRTSRPDLCASGRLILGSSSSMPPSMSLPAHRWLFVGSTASTPSSMFLPAQARLFFGSSSSTPIIDIPSRPLSAVPRLSHQRPSSPPTCCQLIVISTHPSCLLSSTVPRLGAHHPQPSCSLSAFTTYY